MPCRVGKEAAPGLAESSRVPRPDLTVTAGTPTGRRAPIRDRRDPAREGREREAGAPCGASAFCLSGCLLLAVLLLVRGGVLLLERIKQRELEANEVGPGVVG